MSKVIYINIVSVHDNSCDINRAASASSNSNPSDNNGPSRTRLEGEIDLLYERRLDTSALCLYS